MAKIAAHGREIGTLEFTSYAKRYMSDGVILKNQGFGWKLYGKVKPGISPEQAYNAAKARRDAALAERPANANYRKMLHSMCGLNKRWKLHMAISMMPEDPDGVWSEACDGYGDNVHADLDEIVDLCIAYQAAMSEAARFKGE